ncbi:MAG: hypothetical protein WCI74_03920 [Actinomycetes bacterium]
MKKTLLVAALAAVLIFAFVGGAFAASGSSMPNARTAVPNSSRGAATPSQLSTAYVYISWDTIATNAANAGQGSSPHGGYSTTTEKCAVCHAVHIAAPSGTTITSNVTNNQAADTLLKTRAADACGYCHVGAPTTVMSPVYGGIYPIPSSMGHPLGTPNCTECHTNVHGAGADTAASFVGLILKADPEGTGITGIVQTAGVIDSRNPWVAGGGVTGFTSGQYATNASSTARDQGVGIFCAECHQSSYAQVVAGAQANFFNGVDNTNTLPQTGHRVMATATSSWNSFTNIKSSAVSSATGRTVAWTDASNCASCHDSDNGFGAQAFPHVWGVVPGVAITASAPTNGTLTKKWLLVSAYAGGTETTTGANAGSLADGVCLKCHRSGTGGTANSGVGISF